MCVCLCVCLCVCMYLCVVVVVVVVILYFLQHIEDFTTKLNRQKNYITNR